MIELSGLTLKTAIKSPELYFRDTLLKRDMNYSIVKVGNNRIDYFPLPGL